MDFQSRIAKVFFISILISIFVLCNAQTTEHSRKNKTTQAVEKIESDYYSDADIEYEQTLEEIRSAKNWIMLGVIAISFIGSIMILIVLVHFKSRKESRLMYLV